LLHPVRRRVAAALLATVLVLAVPAVAWAMTVQLTAAPGGSRALLLQGRIDTGDAARLGKALRQGGFSAVLLNSPGGSVAEARTMAVAVHALRVPVVVPARAVCASACFLLFAAARDRVAEPGAMIGVHSASVAGGNETMDSLGVTTLMARLAAQYGVPDTITGRMVTTQPGQMAWLTRQDLQAMGVRIVASSGGAAPIAPGSDGSARSDWTRGFERGEAGGEGADCTPPTGIADRADFALGCASGRRSAGARVAGLPGLRAPDAAVAGTTDAGATDWARGFEYGRATGAAARCEAPERPVARPRDWSLGCASGKRAATGG
jgi:hypothetical protein